VNAAIDIDQLPWFAFGATPEEADGLLALVLEGKKTATCGPLFQYVDEGVPVPKPGHRSVAMDSAGKPRCVLEVTEVTQKKFTEVDAAFAYDEGEGDRTLDDWRRIHEEFAHRVTGFSPDMILVCERFRVVERLP
jgi:uncharacterized protein YhfF